MRSEMISLTDIQPAGTDLVSQVAEIFSAQGILSRAKNFEFRPQQQEMAVAFPQTSVKLREAFNRFLAQSRKDGSYERIVKKYYPTAFASFPEYFKGR